HVSGLRDTKFLFGGMLQPITLRDTGFLFCMIMPYIFFYTSQILDLIWLHVIHVS
ncbi:hypothetical protein ACJX0J_007862, partial [Zea mays]